MWEAIRANQTKSTFLIIFLGIVLVALGYVMGLYFAPTKMGGALGAVIALVVWLILLACAFWSGQNIIASSVGAVEIKPEQNKRLFNIIEEMSIASGLNQMPRVFIMEDDSPNAFAMGLKPEKASLAVTTGLLKRLDRNELQGVIAHEVGHIVNYDIRFMTIASVTMGAIVLIADGFFRILRYTGGRRTSSRDSGKMQLIILVIALVAAILAPIAAQILYFACSRKREFLADASAARYTRYPEGLASALEKITSGPKMTIGVNRAVAPLFIANPLKGLSAMSLFATHPPMDKRIDILRKMGGNANFSSYNKAFGGVMGTKSKVIGASSLVGDTEITPRDIASEPPGAPSTWLPGFAESTKAPIVAGFAAAAGESSAPVETEIDRSREVAEMLDDIGGYRPFKCPCGVNIKIPPGFSGDKVRCLRCGMKHDISAKTPADTK